MFFPMAFNGISTFNTGEDWGVGGVSSVVSELSAENSEPLLKTIADLEGTDF